MKLYTLDEKLLTERPEIRIGDKVYPVDDRQKTVEQVTNLTTKYSEEKDLNKGIKETFKLAFGDAAAKEIDEMNLPFVAYQQVFQLVMAAIMGETPEAVAKRFQEATKAEK
ncbi:hypothetical protein [Anaeromassilibacillus senegalensis]|uniref:hypothetical protein n=1 Tax=Anaeromassilibacillus senegalensis TaxID=1673717 RepID=UPI00068299A1|nr:hypothetical protein [Anaeromassilibacillus senegalensis]